jgi:ankyrin repeat protein
MTLHIQFSCHVQPQAVTKGNIALFNAVIAGSIMGVESALKKGAKVNYFHKPEDQKTSLHIAAENGLFDICKILIDAGAAVNSIAITNKDSPLILASSYGHNNIVELLLNVNNQRAATATATATATAVCDIDCQNAYGNSSLHESARHGYLEVTKTLILNKCNINLLNNKGSSALHLICYGDNTEKEEEYPLELVKLILTAAKAKAKASGDGDGDSDSDSYNNFINLQDKRGVTPLIAACSAGRDDIIQLLHNEGANGKIIDYSGMDGLSTAIFHKKKINIKLTKFISKDGKEAPASVFGA